MTAQEKNLIYKIRNELVEKIRKDPSLTYLNQYRSQVKIIDRILNDLG